MSHPHDLDSISKSKKYQTLVAKRSRFSWLMTALVFIVYYGYIFLVAYQKEFLARAFTDSVITYSIPIGIGVILFTIAATGIYVRKANREYDQLTAEIKAGK